MAPYIEWRINGIALPRVARVSSSRAPITTRRTNVEIPGRHGSLPGGLPVLGESTVTITTNPGAASQAELESAVATIQALLTQPVVTLSRVAAGVEVSARAELVSITPGRHTPHAWAELTAILAVPAPFFREPPSLSLVSSSWTADIPSLSLDRLAGSSGPIGDAIVRVGGPATSVAVTDLLSATGISWSGVLASGDWLYLSPRLCRAWIVDDYEAWEPTGTDVSGGLDWPAAGRLQLWPQVTALAVPTRITVSAVGAGRAAGTTLAIRAGRCYL